MNLSRTPTDDDLSNAARAMGRKGGHARAAKRSKNDLTRYASMGRAATSVCVTCGRYFKRTIKRQRRCPKCLGSSTQRDLTT